MSIPAWSFLMVKMRFVCSLLFFCYFSSCILKPYIEPHFGLVSDSSGRDPDFDALVQARWYEYLAEGYLKITESKMAASGSKNETRVNEPVQLYLAHRRLARAQLEITIYSRLLQKELGPSLQKRTLLNFVYINHLENSLQVLRTSRMSLFLEVGFLQSRWRSHPYSSLRFCFTNFLHPSSNFFQCIPPHHMYRCVLVEEYICIYSIVYPL